MIDPYEVLGVQKEATDDEVKKAYRKLAKELHPDRNPNNPASEERLKHVNEAYAILSDPKRRQQHAAEQQWEGHYGGFEGGMHDIDAIMDSFFNGGRQASNARSPRRARGDDVRIALELTLSETYAGCTKDVKLTTNIICVGCTGSGDDPKAGRTKCGVCAGTGIRMVNQGFVHMRAPCRSCEGAGTVRVATCSTCGGRGKTRLVKDVTVTVPAGIDTGDMMKLVDMGNEGLGGRGDAYAVVEVKTDPGFERKAEHLYSYVDMNVAEACLGKELNVTLPDGKIVKVNIPGGKQHGHGTIVHGVGMPRLNTNGRRGNLIMVSRINVPSVLTPQQKDAIEALLKVL